MPRTVSPLPIPTQELLGMQGQLPPYGSMLWEGDAQNILVARIPGRDPDLVNDLERIAEWASARDVMDASACILLTAGKVHTLPMAPMRAHVEQRIAMDRRQAKLLRQQLADPPAFKLYRAVDDPYRRVRLGVLFGVERMREVDDDLLDELAVEMGHSLTGGLDDVHCVHLVAALDDARISSDAFLADMLPRLQNDERRINAQERLLRRQQADQEARNMEAAALRRVLVGDRTTKVAPMRRRVDRHHVDWDPSEENQHMMNIHQQVDALGAQGGAPTAPTSDAMSRLRQHLMAAGYQLRVHPDVPGHDVHLAGERAESPERLLAWSVDHLNRDVAERVLAATRDLHVDLSLVVAPTADADGQRTLVATRVRWVTPDRIEGLRL